MAEDRFMIITCGQCQAKFKVAPEQIKETGSKVRCSNCQYVFTVFRPRLKDDPDAPVSPGGLEGFFNSGLDDGRLDGYGLGDIFGESPSTRPAGRASTEDYEDNGPGLDGFSDAEDGVTRPVTADSSAASMRARRDQRRQLYSDLAEKAADKEDEVEEAFDDGGPVGKDGRPPLRRAARANFDQPETGAEGNFDDPYNGQYDDQYDGQYDDQYDDQYDYKAGEETPDDHYPEENEGEYSYQSTRLARQVNDLGLAADPVDPDKFIDDTVIEGRYYGSQETPAIRAAVTKVPGRSHMKLIIGLAALALVLGIGVYFIANRPAPTALSDGEEAVGSSVAVDEAGLGDQIGTEGITFTRSNQNHYFRENREAGNILIITGMVRNSYPDRRNFIRLRGHLLSADGRSLAERYVYAGNIISEEDLKNLSMNEISSRLSIKGGQDGRNMNIESGQEIPFMLVFDKLPDGMAEYRIDPVGSSPSE